MREELGISGWTAIIVLIAFYFVIKWAVKNGIDESALGQSLLKRNIEELNDKKYN
jgi:hypothetical protein